MVIVIEFFLHNIDVLLYDVNWEYQTTLSDPFGINCGFYLPASQIHKIHNIKKRKSRKVS